MSTESSAEARLLLKDAGAAAFGRCVLVDVNNDGTPELLQENAYYPFGIQVEELSQSSQEPKKLYLYFKAVA